MKKHANKKILLATLLLATILIANTNSVKAQDLIVTNQNDSINCEIIKQKDGVYHIKLLWDNQTMSGTIPKDSIMYIKKNTYVSYRDNTLRPWYPMVSVSAYIGGGHKYGPHRVGITEDFVPIKGSSSDRNAFYTGADLSLFSHDNFGYGLTYNYRNLLNGDLRQNYVGPMIIFRIWDNNKKNYWFANLSLGYGRISHKNAEIKVGVHKGDIREASLVAKSLAGDIAIGYDLKLSRHISTRIKLSTTIGYPKFTKILNYSSVNAGSTYETPDVSGYGHNMNSVNLSVGMSFY